MIELDCGIRLPACKANQEHKPTKEDYERCLSKLVEVIGETTGVVVGYIHKNPYIALRFIGEMRLQGYIRYDYRFKKRIEEDLCLTEARIKATSKLLSVPVEEIHNAPNEPVKSYKNKTYIQVRRGVSRGSRNIKQNMKSYDVVKDIRKQGFRINTFVLGVLAAKPALLSIEDGYIMYERCIHYAHLYKDEPEFMFPLFLCSRGRIYDETTVGFSYQGSDHEKALVIPTYEEPLTEDGYKALLEATYGYSEIEWSVEEIISHAKDPVGTHYIWKNADSKYCYIACADLIRRYHEDPTQPLPAFTPLDGRCSGLQHWSAVTRSTAITNRLGMELEEAPDGLDIYEFMAREWAKTLPIDYQQYATRSAAKIPVMTWGYNATRMTSIEHMSDMFGEKVEWNPETLEWHTVEEGLERKVTAMLGSDLYNRLHETLAPLSEAVRWLSECAVLLNREKIHWVTPDGFVGQQKKVVQEEIRPSVKLSNNSNIQVVLKVDTRKPAPRKHASSLSPNIIHSLDATHLRMVARRMLEEGLPTVFIHDSFATHSNHRARLYKIIVEEFKALYSGDYLKELKSFWENLYSIELPEPPKQGDWAVENVVNCPRFFV